ncbi:calcium/sodium antiporter [Seohaeicola zhoushanensis]|uniref:Sodium:calcium antiporter n=1 Tax=Seohaeicola zhoushanensis TaxID=1569283 RepID=A0A8J3GUK1_9RHOB|nr:calcium/sodium antiporter [Seohaeicola zhoushanensis]GHF37458.1 sodium:calcium antiporter [Seohaeicola zhoushanensis]
MMPWILSALGLVVLLVAGDALVRGSVNLALRIGIPALIVSLTVVAFGTSAPELLISVSAVLDNAPGIALGNVVGSNIANILLVLGIPAMISALHTSQCDTRKGYLQMLGATLLFIALAWWGTLTWVSGLILLAALGAILFTMVREAQAHRANGEAEEPEGADPNMPGWRIAVYLVIGLIGLPWGAHLLVENATIIARSLGVSEAVIGLTLVAVGTSLPELATTVMAALRRQADVALGNVIGSNFFNLLGIIGLASLFGPIPTGPEFNFDLGAMLVAALLLIPFVMFRRDITRLWGVVLTALYLVYLVTVLV